MCGQDPPHQPASAMATEASRERALYAAASPADLLLGADGTVGGLEGDWGDAGMGRGWAGGPPGH